MISARQSGSNCTVRSCGSAHAEKRAYDLFLQNLVKGTSHLSLGQEAIAAGFGVAMRPTTTRSAPTAATTTRSPAACRRDGPGRADAARHGLMRGKGGSMHLTSVEHGMMGSYAIIGAHLPIANGAAWPAQYRGRPGRGRLLLRRRHDQHRRVPRGAELRGDLEAAGRLRLREQPLHGVHADRRRDGGAELRPPTARRPTGWSRSSSTATTPTPCTATAQTAFDQARAGRRPVADRGLTYRHGGHSRADPAQVPARRRGRGVAGARPDQDLSRAAASSSASPTDADRDDRGEVRERSRRGDRGRQGRADRRRRHPDTDVWADGGSAWRN